MNKITSWLIGLGLGLTVGAVLVAIFSPVSGDEVIRRLRAGFAETLEEARRAAEDRRKTLEAELSRMQSGQTTP